MNLIKDKNLKNVNFIQKDELFEELKPSYYSFGMNPLVMIRNLKSCDRNILKNVFLKYYSNLKNITNINIDLNYKCDTALLDNLISNMFYIIKNKNASDYNEIEYGIYSILHIMNKSKKRELNSLKTILFFNDEIKSYSNKSLIKIYKKTFNEYSSALSIITDENTYVKLLNKNIILEIKRNDIINEFKRRCNIAKICDIVDESNIYQGDGYFIPRFDLEDDIIVFFKNTPYTLSSFKKNKLLTRKKNGKICWK